MAPIIDLERIDGPGDDRPGRTVVESPSPKSSGRTVAALVGLVVLVIGALVLLSGGGGADDAGGPATTEARTTTTSRAPRRTTEPPAPSVAQVAVPAELRARLGGRSIYLVGRSTIARLEVDTGQVTVVPGLLARRDFPSDAAIVDGKLVVSQPGRTMALPADLSGPGEFVAGSLDAIPQSGRLFELRWIEGSGFDVDEFDTSGNVLASWNVPAGGYPNGVLGDRLVLQAAGRVYLLAPNGEAEPIGAGDVLAAGERALVLRQCDHELICWLVVQDPATGEVRARAKFVESFFSPQFGTLVAPDGLAAVVTDDAGTAWFTDLVTGETIAVLDPRTRPAWSASGDVVVAQSGEGDRGLLAVVRDGGFTAVPFTLPGVNLAQDTALLVIG